MPIALIAKVAIIGSLVSVAGGGTTVGIIYKKEISTYFGYGEEEVSEAREKVVDASQSGKQAPEAKESLSASAKKKEEKKEEEVTGSKGQPKEAETALQVGTQEGVKPGLSEQTNPPADTETDKLTGGVQTDAPKVGGDAEAQVTAGAKVEEKVEEAGGEQTKVVPVEEAPAVEADPKQVTVEGGAGVGALTTTVVPEPPAGGTGGSLTGGSEVQTVAVTV